MNESLDKAKQEAHKVHEKAHGAVSKVRKSKNFMVIIIGAVATFVVLAMVMGWIGFE